MTAEANATRTSGLRARVDGLDRALDLAIDSMGLVLIFLAVVLVFWPSHSAQAGAVVTAAGLFGVGHGIRRHGKNPAPGPPESGQPAPAVPGLPTPLG